ncbi:MAG: hypothetical protein AAB595_01140 [Patescibacteria group bacterium]
MKTQKNITISLISLIIQFAIIAIPVFLNFSISQKIGTTLFWIFGVISFIYAVISLIKREAASAVGIILLEFLFLFWTTYKG